MQRNETRYGGSVWRVAGLAPSPALHRAAAAVCSFVIAHQADYPAGQMTVAILCLVLILAWLYRAAVASLSA
ncbi:MAG: hypothetical protein ACREVH_00440 [Gammaproteobacteria bacterium]